MIPMLFEAGSTEFTATSDGCLGSILDCYSCTVTEERNGSFEVELEMPLDTALHDSIVPMNLIVCKVGNDSRGWQAFEIYKTEEKLDGTMTVNGQHISYMMSNYQMTTISYDYSKTIDANLESLLHTVYSTLNRAYVVPLTPFSIVSDMTTSKTSGKYSWVTNVAQSLKNFIYESEPDDEHKTLQEVLGIYDYDILPDNYTIHINTPKTEPTALVSYGLNVASATNTTDVSDIVSAVIPYAMYNNAPVYIVGRGDEVEIQITDNGYGHVEILDLTDEFDDTTPTPALVKSKALEYIAANPDKYPTTVDPSIDIEYVDVDGYGNRLCLLDMVLINLPTMGKQYTMKVTKIVYDSLAERVTDFEVGEYD